MDITVQQEILPVTVTPEGITVDESFLTVTKTHAFLSKHLRRYYLSVSPVYPKVIYKTYWIEEKVSGPLTNQHMKVKATYIYPDIVGIEYAKTKTIHSVNSPRLLETLQGTGMLVLQRECTTLLEESTPYVIQLAQGTKAVIPANWEYTIVNTGKEPLVTAELYHASQPLHQCACARKGSGVYVIERNGVPEIVKNSQYKNVNKYATVSSEQYVTSLNLDPTQSLSQQLPSFLASHWFTCPSCEWVIPLGQSQTGAYTF